MHCIKVSIHKLIIRTPTVSLLFNNLNYRCTKHFRPIHKMKAIAVTLSDAIEAALGADDLDRYNKPRTRRNLIHTNLKNKSETVKIIEVDVANMSSEEWINHYSQTNNDGNVTVHTKEMMQFLASAWDEWVKLEEGRDPISFHPNHESDTSHHIPALVPAQFPLLRELETQRSGTNVMGKVGYYCNDVCTPIVGSLLSELKTDTRIVLRALEELNNDDVNVAYALTTHPGHHTAFDNYGGYCYVNQAAFAARLFQTKYGRSKVAVLDVDYHAGNGTVSIFYKDPSVFVASIHCDPAYDYPYVSGFSDQFGSGEGEGYTCNLTLPPGTRWESEYRPALQKALMKIRDFGATALVVSLGLDTYENDPVTVRRAGFNLSGLDYYEMGKLIHQGFADNCPILVVQEGGYKMEIAGEAVADFIHGLISS